MHRWDLGPWARALGPAPGPLGQALGGPQIGLFQREYMGIWGPGPSPRAPGPGLAQGPSGRPFEPHMAQTPEEPHLGWPGPGQGLAQPGPWEGPGTPILGPILGAKSPVCPHVSRVALSHMGPPRRALGGPGWALAGPIWAQPRGHLNVRERVLAHMGQPRGWPGGPWAGAGLAGGWALGPGPRGWGPWPSPCTGAAGPCRPCTAYGPALWAGPCSVWAGPGASPRGWAGPWASPWELLG